MCLAVPGKVVEIIEENGLLMGIIDYSGIVSKACLAYVPDVKIGQYTIIHAGFAISILDEDEANRSIEMWKKVDENFQKENNDNKKNNL